MSKVIDESFKLTHSYTKHIDQTRGLKLRLNLLQQTLLRIQKQVDSFRQDIILIKQQKDIVEKTLNFKSEQTKKNLLNSLHSFENKMVNQMEKNKQQVKFIDVKVSKIRMQQMESQQKLLSLQRKVHQLQVHLG